jgi:hypothetical protein
VTQLRSHLRERTVVPRPTFPAQPQRHSKRCTTSGKVRWLTAHDAWIVVLRLGNTGSYYRCPFCPDWHVSHYPPKETHE